MLRDLKQLGVQDNQGLHLLFHVVVALLVVRQRLPYVLNDSVEAENLDVFFIKIKKH